ncbi:dihydroxyacetone kinase [Streptomyces regalis]|uniref:Dihydroxyacetone kinase n=1 Tax=Streptomyces regalis TaxID=68262 RepID=A0A0X3V4Q3_9ACTN|nr:dihydroxyacetone kinase [Streptomyces regalis]
MDSARTRAWLRTAALYLDRDKDRLTRLDLAIGDGDHGVNMHRGFLAVTAALDEWEQDDLTAGELLIAVGDTLVSTIGGASGPLFGSSFRAMGKTLSAPGPDDDSRRFAAALSAARASVHRLGAAEPGDKTMYDVYEGAVDAFTRVADTGGSLEAAARAAADAADAGVRATELMQARRGRASYLGLRSVGHQDPGAASLALIFHALAHALEAK